MTPDHNLMKRTVRFCSPHLTRALTANRTTVESRKRGVTRMWKSAKAANASEDLGPLALRM